MMQANFHGIDVDIATKYGIEEALVINSFQYWLNKNYAEGRNQHDGRTWTFNTNEALAKSFPYMNARKIRYTIDGLVAKGILIKGNYNKAQYDRTMWYAFTEEEKWLYTVRNDRAKNLENSHLTKTANGNDEIENSHLTKTANGNDEIVQPIPVTNPITNQEITKTRESNTHAHEAEPKSPSTANLPLSNENTGFNPPTVEDVMTYCASMCLKMPLDEAESFIDHYESVGWMSGNTRIKDWRGKARSWAKRKQIESKTPSPKKPFTKAGSKDFGNLPEYTLPEKYRSEPNYSEGAIDSTATPVFNGLIGSDE